MATAVVMPKLGNSVESTIIVAWKKAIGDSVEEGDILCEVETDKAVMEVPSTVSGTLLAILCEANEEVPVLAEIAVVGDVGEDVSAWGSGGSAAADVGANEELSMVASQPSIVNKQGSPQRDVMPTVVTQSETSTGAVSPRARGLAASKGLGLDDVAGSGPGGRIIERDVVAALAARPKLTPVAQAMVESGEYTVPAQGSGPGGRVTKQDLLGAAAPASTAVAATAPAETGDEYEEIPVRGVRKVIAERMLNSLQTTAQLTLNATADARALQAMRARFKASPEAFELQGITLNDMVMLATIRALQAHPDLNARFEGTTIKRFRPVHLGFAVDTPRGLLVPVIRNAQTLTLKQLAAVARDLASAAQAGKSTFDDLTGGTFTVTNLGFFGVESFTPVLNPPEVAILGVSNINLKPVAGPDGDVEFIPHMGLSLTINHQVVDGAPAAKFLQTVTKLIAEFDLLLAG